MKVPSDWAWWTRGGILWGPRESSDGRSYLSIWPDDTAGAYTQFVCMGSELRNYGHYVPPAWSRVYRWMHIKKMVERDREKEIVRRRRGKKMANRGRLSKIHRLVWLYATWMTYVWSQSIETGRSLLLQSAGKTAWKTSAQALFQYSRAAIVFSFDAYSYGGYVRNTNKVNHIRVRLGNVFNELRGVAK